MPAQRLFCSAADFRAAAAIESNALLEQGWKIIQPIPYIDGSPLAHGDAPDSEKTIAQLHRLDAKTAIVLYFLYARPELLSVAPKIYDLRDYVEPELQSNPNYHIEEVTANTEVYGITGARHVGAFFRAK